MSANRSVHLPQAAAPAAAEPAPAAKQSLSEKISSAVESVGASLKKATIGNDANAAPAVTKHNPTTNVNGSYRCGDVRLCGQFDSAMHRHSFVSFIKIDVIRISGIRKTFA